VFQSKSELFSKKIQTLIFSCPARPRRAGQKQNRNLLGRKKFLWGVGQKEIFCALSAARKIFAYLLFLL
jgi:hypothetical protein